MLPPTVLKRKPPWKKENVLEGCFYKLLFAGRFQERPDRVDCTASRPLCEVKGRRAGLLRRWGTTWKAPVLLLFFVNSHFGFARSTSRFLIPHDTFARLRQDGRRQEQQGVQTRRLWQAAVFRIARDKNSGVLYTARPRRNGERQEQEAPSRRL